MITPEQLNKLKQQYHRSNATIVPVEVRVISDLLDYIDKLKKGKDND